MLPLIFFWSVLYDNKKEVWISKKVDVYALLDADEIDKLIDALNNKDEIEKFAKK